MNEMKMFNVKIVFYFIHIFISLDIMTRRE